jgi:2,3-bisphosphoglycerate-independent phosphoglycerate mutase
MNKKDGPIALVILDGWGCSSAIEGNAIAQSDPKTFNYLWEQYPHTTLQASGEAVGLPPGTVGNSEVGHLTIGAGRIIPQSLSHINQALADGSFFNNPVLSNNLEKLTSTSNRLHIIGLLSDGGVHSSIQHLYALIQAAAQEGLKNIFIHAFLDGRDVSPKSAENYLQQLGLVLQKYNAQLGSVCGRFYAMDRGKNWNRTEQVYDMLTGKQTASGLSWQEIIQENYSSHVSDEFILPTLIESDASIKNGDGLIFFNFRPDRMRQLTSLFLSIDTVPNGATRDKRNKIHPLFVTTMTQYSNQFSNPMLLPQENVTNTLFDQLEAMKKTVFAIAETEKYAHITYFFNGGRETKRANETRVLVPSHPEKTYSDDPRMSADLITQKVLESLATDPQDFYLINYANADMVGHSGNLASTIKAITCLDEQIEKLYQAFVQEHNGTLILTADHGNAEEMLDANKQPKTSHTKNAVPCIVINKKLKGSDKKLCIKELSDIASLVVKLLNNQFAPFP